MKNLKKLASVLVAVIFVFAMCVPAFAQGTGKITITNPAENQTYKIYKMFSFTPTADNSKTGYYTVEDAWENFLKGDGAEYFQINDYGTIEVTKGNLADAAKAALAYAQENSIKPVETKTTKDNRTSEETIVFDSLEFGYYLIDSSLGALCALTNTDSEKQVTEKNEAPTLDKQVKEDSTDTWGTWNDADIDQEVEYKATITVGKGAQNYVMHDKMEKGLTYVGVTSVTVGGVEVSADDYIVKTSDAITDGCTFEVEFKNEYIETLTQGTEIVVEYKAKLNKDAEIYSGSNDNEAWLEYGDKNETAHDKTNTYTYEFKLIKTDKETGDELKGAQFKLYRDKDCKNEIPVVKVSDGVYRVAEEGEQGEVIEVGTAMIKGLDADTYYLKETLAPTGYNMLKTAKEITVNAHNSDSTEYVVAEITVENSTGSLLPETGGMGTTMFYVLGGLLVVGAAILLVAKKRMAFEA